MVVASPRPLPEIEALLVAVAARVAALDRQQAALAAAVEAYEDALASAEFESVRPEMFR